MLRARLRAGAARLLLLGLGAAPSGGCQTWGARPAVADGAAPEQAPVVRAAFWDRIDPFAGPAAEAPAESLVLRPEGLVADKAPARDSAEADLAAARELFRRGDFAGAESAFRRIADNARSGSAAAEEARFFEAECLRNQGRYPRAADTYADLVKKYERGAHRDLALQRMYDIANFWLDDTRAEVEEKESGKHWITWPRFVSFEKSKPFLDREGRAVEKLEQVRLNDGNGPLADKALFVCGSVKFLRENYREAEQDFTELCDRHPNSPLAAQAIEYAIIAKHLSTGGSDYDGRKVAEARRLVQAAFDNYPELAGQKKEFLSGQLVSITMQQAEKDFKVAELYRRQGHPGPAFFYYGIVVRTYPGTVFAEKAARLMEELKAKHAGQDLQASAAPAAQAAPLRPAPRQPEAAPPPRQLAPPPPNGLLVPGQ